MKRSLKAFGYILRQTPDRTPQLLVLSFADEPTLPLRLPGGTLYPGEDPVAGLRRELKEETGLDGVSVIRKLGVQHYYKSYTQANVERHDYLLQAPDDLPASFSHVVQGEGGDAGDVFNFQWIGAEALDRLDLEFRKNITPEYVPEFFRAH